MTARFRRVAMRCWRGALLPCEANEVAHLIVVVKNHQESKPRLDQRSKKG
jgi:hypothetical protein